MGLLKNCVAFNDMILDNVEVVLNKYNGGNKFLSVRLFVV